MFLSNLFKPPKKKLLEAINNGDVVKVKSLLDKGTDVNSRTKDGLTALMFALNLICMPEERLTEIVRMLLDKGADVNAKDKDGLTPLLWAIDKQWLIEFILYLLDKGADVNARNAHGDTALIIASAHGNTETVKMLLDKGADVNAKNNGGYIALFVASIRNHTEIVKLLNGTSADVIRDCAASFISNLKNSDHFSRGAAALVLRHISDIRAVEPLSNVLLNDKDREIRLMAAEALGEIGDVRAVAPLLKALDDGENKVREGAMEALIKFGSIVVEPLITALKNNLVFHEDAMQYILGKIGVPAVDPLIALLDDVDKCVREFAAEALGKIGTHTVQPLIIALKNYNVQVRRSAVLGLYWNLNLNARIVGPLIDALKDTDSNVRMYVTKTLGKIAGIRVKDQLITALKDESSDVRKAAVEALGEIGIPVEELLTTALKDESENVRECAEFYLHQISVRQKIINELIQSNFDRVRSYLSADNWMTRGEAVSQLAELIAPETLELLGSVLRSDPNPSVRESAVIGIGKLAVQLAIPEAEDLLISALKDKEREWVCKKAAQYLELIGGEKAEQALTEYLLNRPGFSGASVS